MASEVTGIRFVNFKDERTGKPVTGLSLWVSTPIRDGDGEGKATDKVFVANRYIEEQGGEVPAYGDMVDVLYNKYGKCVGVRIVERAATK